jgi:hypothetical protein
LLIAYIAKWKLYHLSLRILLVCFDKLNQHLAKKPAKARPARPSSSSSTIRPGSKYVVDGPVSAPGETTEVEKAALSLWKTTLFEPFQERLINAALAKITEDRDSSIQDTSEELTRSMEIGKPELSSLAAASTDTSNSTPASRGKESRGTVDLWVPMGGDVLVRDLVDNILKLGDALAPGQKLKTYEEAFEKHYLLRLNEYFERESSAYIASNGITSFISKAVLRLNQEELRSSRFLHPTSKAKVTAALQQVLILNHKDAMMSECEQMFINDRKPQLHALHSLLSRLDNGCDDMKRLMFDFIIQTSSHALRNLVEVSNSESSDSSTQSQRSSAAAGKRKKSDRGNAQNVSPAGYVDTMTQLHQKFSRLVSEAFSDDSAFVTTMDQAYKDAVNSNAMCDDPTLAPELLARQSDALLRKGAIPLSEADLDTKLAQLVSVFKYIGDKDIFQNFYSKLLAKRLINASSVSDDTERAMIASLKPICSAEFMSRLHRMFTDIQLSKDVSDKFKGFVDTLGARPLGESIESGQLSSSSPSSSPSQISTNNTSGGAGPQSDKSTTGEAMEITHSESSADANSDNQPPQKAYRPSIPLDFSVFVLTTGSWPLMEQTSSFNVPEVISEYLQCFSIFYNSLHIGRKLNWLYTMHRGEVKIGFAKKKYDVGATAFQLGALLAFDSDETSTLTLDQLTVIIGLRPAESIAVVKNLLECKLLSLVTASSSSGPTSSDGGASNEGAAAPSADTDTAKSKRSLTAGLNGGSLLQLNTSFANKKLKFKLPAPPPVEGSKSAQAAVQEEIDGDRAQFLQAVIVRTMKTRKTLTHTQLVQEVLDQCKSRFRATVTLIKRQIDSLIEMEYLMRTKEKADVYQYCA